MGKGALAIINYFLSFLFYKISVLEIIHGLIEIKGFAAITIAVKLPRLRIKFTYINGTVSPMN